MHYKGIVAKRPSGSLKKHWLLKIESFFFKRTDEVQSFKIDPDIYLGFKNLSKETLDNIIDFLKEVIKENIHVDIPFAIALECFRDHKHFDVIEDFFTKHMGRYIYAKFK